MTNEARQDYVEHVKSMVEDWRSTLEDLQSDAERGDPGMENDYERDLADLRSTLEQIDELIRTLERASEEEWDDLQEELEEEMDIFQSSLGEVRENIDDV
ncbi:MAG: hypothetical protein ACD_28C00151G0002 [uncultured bacterium]|nr:MAG: hypothetical protein ACD_28C00151G0002 [uncultured bacterium]KKT74746.1 MAG: hypothetical protein UW70_C0046G0004 [Candidatus Peregrinibacteria bacterium GW2011_GWA2_44_7]